MSLRARSGGMSELGGRIGKTGAIPSRSVSCIGVEECPSVTRRTAASGFLVNLDFRFFKAEARGDVCDGGSAS